MSNEPTPSGAASLAKMSQTAFLDNIRSSFDKQTHGATFACGGTVAHDVQIRFGESGTGYTLRFPIGEEKDAFTALIDACTPASFGRGGEAVMDETYRKAGKLDTNDFATSFCPSSTGIINAITQVLLPDVPLPNTPVTNQSKSYTEGFPHRSVRAELYKLNVYSAPSGLFKAHVDTPRSEHQFGSLVVALPAAHQGGELVVRNAGNEVCFDWSNENATDLKWAAFYSDCEHEVLEVTKGHRLTLTYNLYMESQPIDNKDLKPVHQLQAIDPVHFPLYSAFHTALNNPAFLRRGKYLGVHLTHSYAHTSQHVNVQPQSLKGADATIYAIASSLGLKCSLHPMFKMRGYEYDEDEDEDFEYSKMLFAPKFAGFRRLSEMYGDDFGMDLEEMRKETRGTILNDKQVVWLNRADDKLKEAAFAYPSYGNEPDMDVQWSTAVLLILVPPFASRGSTST